MNSKEIFNRLIDQYHENKLSHAFLLVTNDAEKCEKDLKNMIKNISCDFEFNSLCQKDCNICRLIDNNELPDVINIFPENNIIKKESIINLQSIFSKKANYISKKIYIINSADKMNSYSANSLLKFFEEPEANIIGFLITTNKENILPTILSRCEIIQVQYEESANLLDNEITDQIDKIIDQIIIEIEQKKLINLFTSKNLVLEKLDTKEKVIYFFEKICSIYGALLNNKLSKNKDINDILSKLSVNQLVKRIKIMDNINREAKYNVNLELILDKLYIEMVDCNE